MKYRSSAFVALLFGILVFGAFYPAYDVQQRERVILDAVIRFIDQAHFSPKSINDDFSAKVYDNYLSYIDPAKRFLTQDDLAQLEKYKLQIDDLARERSLEFFDLSLKVLDQSISDTKAIYQEVIAEKVNLELEESIELDRDKRNFASSDAELKELWRKTLKYDILGKLDRAIENQEDLEEGEEKKSIAELKAKAIEDTKENFDDYFDRISDLRRSDRFEAYLNAITHLQDPHSDYFNPKEKKNFDINMGGKLEGIGARLQNDGSYTKVISIVPGGPAWRGEELEVNDVITAVAQGDDEPVDITDMRVDDVVQLIRGKKGTIVVLSIKRATGEKIKVRIERDVVELEDAFAKSLILSEVEEGKDIGYIKLPKFYSSFEREGGTSCAVDIANEIEKLKAENVSGIILDLRNNGGGSLRDVVDMSGLFIKDGPIVQVKPRDTAPYVYQDRDPETRYDGPLVVMVNSFSASASEILAAALQDYNRAVIIGSTSTFGKGTVQRFYDLDNAIRGNEDIKPLGQIKLTSQKFFRVNGGSTQLKGVVPDIVLADTYNYIESGEKDYENPMKWTQIDPVKYTQSDFVINNLEEIKEKSKIRVASNESFQMVDANAKRVKATRDMTKYPLNFATYQNLLNEREEEAKKYDDLFEEELTSFKVYNLDVDTKSIQIDDATQEKNDDWKSNVSKDFYIEEAVFIIRDLIASVE